MPTPESDGDEPTTRIRDRRGARGRARPEPRARGLGVLAVLVVVLVVLVTVAAAGATLWVGHLARSWSAGLGAVEDHPGTRIDHVAVVDAGDADRSPRGTTVGCPPR
ncbi:hypothetical protein [Frigoribacterium salinisoli]